jgi:hypothetical protein
MVDVDRHPGVLPRSSEYNAQRAVRALEQLDPEAR